ncbi:MAG: RNA 2',3'-cyclic phosphodiesterase [Pseudomonadota bacterium]
MEADQTQSLRLFYGLWPDELTRAALAGLQTRVKGRKTHHDNLHLTLAFLGEQPATMLPELKQILAGLPRPDMTLVLDRVGYFTRPRIAWAGMSVVPEELAGLHQALMAALAEHNIVAASHDSFKPHVTLAREAKEPDDFPFDTIHWQARQTALIQSTTGPDGLRYRVLASCDFDAGAD